MTNTAPSIAHPTGERFIMRKPVLQLSLVPKDLRNNQKILQNWDSLRQTIERCGGQVEVMPAMKTVLHPPRDPMYVRDAALFLPNDSGDDLVFSQLVYPHERKERNALRNFLKDRDMPTISTEPGMFEGGNLVYDAKRHILFWGVCNSHYLDELQHGGMREWLPDIAAEKSRRAGMKQETNRYFAEAFAEAAPSLQSDEALTRDGKNLRVAPMFIPDKVAQDCYHLDGALGMLPTGEAVVCYERLSKTAIAALEKLVGREHIIRVDENAAHFGATNFITVGSNLILPYAPREMKERVEALGYRVIDPSSQGLQPLAGISALAAACVAPR